MALALISELPVPCREWLLYENVSENELGVAFLANASGVCIDKSDRFVVPRRETEASAVPLLVPEYDNGEFVLGHSHYLTLLDYVGAENICANSEHAELVFERNSVEQRFALFRGEESRLVLVCTTLFDDGGFFVKRVQLGTAASLGHIKVTQYLCLRGDLSEPEFQLTVDVGKVCDHHASDFEAWRLAPRQCDSLTPAQPDAKLPLCACELSSAPFAAAGGGGALNSIWQLYQHCYDKFLDKRPVYKTFTLYSMQRAGGGGGGGALVKLPLQQRRTVMSMAQLKGERLQRLKVEYVQARLETMISFRGLTISEATAPARRFNALLSLESRPNASAAAGGVQSGGANNVALLCASTPSSNVSLAESSLVTSRDENTAGGGSGGSGGGGAEFSLKRSRSASLSEIKSDDEDGSRQKSMRCKMCTAVFLRRYELNRHVKSTHLHEKRHVCEHCSRSFYQRSHMLTHVREVHEGVRDKSCEQCGRAFVSAPKLRRHVEMVHLNKRPHACEHCGSSFSQRSDLQRHVRVQHAEAAVSISAAL